MMFSRAFAVHAGFAPLCRIQSQIQTQFRTWAIERVVSTAPPSGDLRWAIAALAATVLAAVDAVIRRQLVLLARHTMGRALRGARFAGSLHTADSMVATGGR
jgi:hypothetical protein